jgi:integrase
MPRRPDFEPYQQGERWILNIPPAMSADGRRHRKSFLTVTAAQKHASKIRAAHGSGLRGAMIPTTLALQAAEAARILDGTGISLVDAARAAADRAKVTGPVETFKARLDRALLANEARWSDVYSDDVAALGRHLPRWFMQTNCRMIDAVMIEKAITEGKSLKRSSIDHRARYIRAVLGHRERHHKAETPDLMTTGQVEALLCACATVDEKRCVAVLLFAGIRPDAQRGEISRLDWEAFKDGRIYVSRDVSKVGDRYVPITPRLARSIKGHPKTGPVTPTNWKKAWARLRKAAGVSHLSDCTRHAFASHALAAWGEDAAKAAMGHTEGSRTIFRHYARAVTKEQGEAYFR